MSSIVIQIPACMKCSHQTYSTKMRHSTGIVNNMKSWLTMVVYSIDVSMAVDQLFHHALHS